MINNKQYPFQYQTAYFADGEVIIEKSDNFAEGNPNTMYESYDALGTCISYIYCPYIPDIFSNIIH